MDQHRYRTTMYGMANTSESMILGSPVSASTSAHQPQFLPGYLLGDSSFTGGGSHMTQQRLWTPGGGHSPPQSNISRLMSPSGQYSGLLASPRSQQRLSGSRDYSHRAKDKSGAPPVLGLFDQITSPIASHSNLPSYQRGINLDASSYRGQAQPISTMDYDTGCHQPSTRQITARSEVPSSGFFSPNGDLSSLLTSPGRQTPPSPPQVDPFYTQGESIRPDDRLDETWITVFGFTAAAASYILQQFSLYGNITQHIISPEGNWMHLHFQSKIQAKKALSKNGKVFGNGIMVGVQQCIDKKLMDQHRESSPLVTGGSSFTSGSHSMGSPMLQIGNEDITPARRVSNMRPLTAAYRASSSEHDVLNKTNTPQKSTSVIGKALEYMFGW